MLAAANKKPVYVECNAVSPQTMLKIADVIAATGCPFVGAGIIGPPPKPGTTNTKIYASGPHAPDFARLNDYGLIVRVLDGPLTAASALKMSYAGITKGFTALGAAMMLAATRGGSAEALKAELAESQPALLGYLSHQMPSMYSKAYRWVAELDEIATFVGEEHPEHDMLTAAARLYERLADDVDGEKKEIGSLDQIPQIMTSETSILSETRTGYRVITLNRPDKLNAFNEAMHQALRKAIEDAEADEGCRALLITGAGRGFCTGQDLSDRLAKPGETVVLGGALEAHYNPLVRKLRALPFPVVAAVNGVAAGAGCNIALACDIVIASLKATFIQSFARVGLVPDSGGTWFLPRLVGDARARGLALLAQDLTAEKAASWGLIWRAVEDEVLMHEATRICEHFALAPTQGLALIKRALNASATNTLDAQLDLERDFQRAASLTPDYAEGVRAFMEKRKANFTGRKK